MGASQAIMVGIPTVVFDFW